ncbi:MAG TPA: hypothetical protein DDW76_06540 [Cyanobacteria bacterium UBA11369]|nr:hypothetical protein [Cyanobacteria bacterium UBA11371]HBE48459.1 hypothetical protein [Cyanobacteria bacterium UBA11369]
MQPEMISPNGAGLIKLSVVAKACWLNPHRNCSPNGAGLIKLSVVAKACWLNPHRNCSPAQEHKNTPASLLAELPAISGVEQLANFPNLWHHSELRLQGTKL